MEETRVAQKEDLRQIIEDRYKEIIKTCQEYDQERRKLNTSWHERK